MLKFFKSNVFILPFLFFVAHFVSKYSNLNVLRFFYTISVLFVDLVGLLIPFLVFIYIFSTILNVGQKALASLTIMFFLIIVSNVLTVLTTYGISYTVLPFLPLKNTLTYNSDSLVTSFLSFPISGTVYLKIIMLLAVASALFILLFGSWDFNKKAIRISASLKEFITGLFSVIFSYFLPVYILGFLLKAFYEGGISYIYNNFSVVLLIYVAFASTYIASLYVISCKYASIEFLKSLKNIVPAGLTGFMTMSSAATLPVTISSVQNTLNDEKATYLIVPSSVNIHLIGDNIFVVLTAFAILILNGLPLPSFMEFLPFLLFYNIAILASAGIPGGNVLIMVAVLQSYLYFTPEMSKLFITLYILQDSFLTAFNILGNGAFAIFFKGILNRFSCLNNN